MKTHGKLRGIIFASAILIASACWFAGVAKAQVKGLSYTLTPIGEGMFFSDDAALSNSLLYGGRIGFGFGEYIELHGLYLYGDNFERDFGDLATFDDATLALLRQLPARDVQVQRYGADIKFNIGRGRIFPFVTLSSGVLRFDPDGLNKSESIYLGGGVGVQYGLTDRATLILQAKNLSYRYNPTSTFLSDDDLTTVGLTADDGDLISVNNLAASAGVQFYLGGRSSGQLTDLDRALQDQFRRGLTGFALRVEPTAAEIDFEPALGYQKDQRFVGVSAGIDLGTHVGLRGFYWRGATDDSWVDFEDIQAFGGELKLAFTEYRVGLTPYVMVGGGLMDVRSGYVGNGVADPEDRSFAFGGLGVVLPLGNSVSVDGGVRSVLMSSSGIDNVSDPGSVEANTMIAVGISFGIGGGGDKSGGVFGREIEASRTERRELMSKIDAQEQKLTATQARIDSLAAIIAAAEKETARRSEVMPQSGTSTDPSAQATTTSAARDTSAAVKKDAVKLTAGETSAQSLPRTDVSTSDTRWVSFPVPTEGELYLRYGKPGGVSFETISGDPVTYLLDPVSGSLVPLNATQMDTSRVTSVPLQQVTSGTAGTPRAATPAPASSLTPEQIQDIVRGVVREERKAARADSVSQQATMNELQRRLDERFSRMETRLESIRRERAQTVDQPIQQIDVVDSSEPVVVQPEPSEQPVSVQATTTARRTRFVGIHPLTGYNINRPHQGLIGVRGEFHRSGQLYRLTPEVIVGFGDDQTTFNVNLNGMYNLDIGLFDSLYPYVGGGVGLLDIDDLELVLNLLLGSNVRTPYGTFFIEYVNQDFDNNRLLGGYRLEF